MKIIDKNEINETLDKMVEETIKKSKSVWTDEQRKRLKAYYVEMWIKSNEVCS